MSFYSLKIRCAKYKSLNHLQLFGVSMIRRRVTPILVVIFMILMSMTDAIVKVEAPEQYEGNGSPIPPSAGSTKRSEYDKPDATGGNATPPSDFFDSYDYGVWAWGDTQPQDTEQWNNVYTAIHDMDESCKLDIALHTGDIVQNGWYDAGDYTRLINYLNDSNLQLGLEDHYFIPGNHDLRNDRELQQYSNRIVAYTGTKDPWMYSVVIGSNLYIHLTDSEYGKGDRSAISPEQLQWLNDTIAENQDKNIIVQTHYCHVIHEMS